MFLGDRGSRWRCLLVWASGTSTLGLVVVLLLPAARDLGGSDLGSLPFDLLLGRVAAAALCWCAAWAWVGLTGTVLEAWRGTTAPRRGPWRLPPGVRRLVLAGCGVALASSTVVPAQAVATPGHHHGHGVRLLAGLPLPERAVAPRTKPVPHRALTREVTVRPGDTLWAIAERDLPSDVTDSAIDERWHDVYAANRHLIGPDPDLIEPGQHLRLPPRKDRS